MTTQNTVLDTPVKPSNSYWFYLVAVFGAIATFVIIGNNHIQGEAYGWVSLLPTLFVLAFALITHRTVEALFSGAIMGLLMIDPANLVGGVVDVSLSVMMDETIAWVILVCGLMGGLIAILEKGGSILSLSSALVTKVKSRKQSMLLTFLLGILVFIDDYLNAIAISSSMKRITDSYKISREKLAYLVDSTAAPICIIIPISTWAVFFSSLLEDNNVAETGGGLGVYIQAIPYMAYGWVTLVVVLLVATDKLPDMGAMKVAEARAKSGQVKPEGATEINFGDNIEPHPNAFLGVMNFVLPMVVLVGASWYFDIDLLAGVFAAIMFTIFFYGIQRLLSLDTMFDAIYDGIKVMMVPLATVVGGFMLKNVNDQLGLTQYVIEAVSPWMSPGFFPVIIFLVMTGLVFATASSWGLFAVAMPIVFPLGEHLGVPVHITVGALLSASAAGSHSCFFSDSTVLSAQGSGCTAMQHALTQLPYALIGIISTAVFFIAVA
ncbi:MULTISPECIES: Na+/H+ antiporter NhaC family protein [Photobacterium]|uniref:Sodium:proton antiporter n=1 Tax=Photobacterium ganghwense TaxID=320778 RepID=A0A0J1HA38_9GAMM|nr:MULTISPECIES: Na+/H+ antiporter NhaC family protein [Photobacterium]KLV08553.1 sodium:proton antiporter [Photobacterium ganghwense]MBV1839124.1 sodium:proton antiporter [Photobacterium ganghwense]PSU10664.1 sodium:proton antiporter [Photobacterium ganghwense]QSV12807.1 sodium:proton antiporter [Photobacterium ganghwense]